MNKAIEYLKSKNIEYRPEYKDETKISSLKVPFTSDEIVDLLDKEGESLTVCCSAISELRDIMFSVVREGRWIYMHQLEDVHDLALQHAHFEKTDNEAEDWKSPILRLVYIWENIKSNAKKRSAIREKFVKIQQDNPREALSTISSLATYLSFHSVISNPVTKEDFRHVPLMIDFIIIANAMKCYLEHSHKIAEKLQFEPMKVFALTDKKGNIYKGGCGACVFGDLKTAEAARDGDEKILIRTGTISLEKGLLLEPVEASSSPV